MEQNTPDPTSGRDCLAQRHIALVKVLVEQRPVGAAFGEYIGDLDAIAPVGSGMRHVYDCIPAYLLNGCDRVHGSSACLCGGLRFTFCTSKCIWKLTRTNFQLLLGSVGQWKFFKRQNATREHYKHVSHTKLNLLACIGDLVAVAPRSARLFGKLIARQWGQAEVIVFEVHDISLPKGNLLSIPFGKLPSGTL
jgi:hypothetical protein